MATNLVNGPGVDTRHQGYNLRSGRRIEYDSPLVSRVPRSPARDELNTAKISRPTVSCTNPWSINLSPSPKLHDKAMHWCCVCVGSALSELCTSNYVYHEEPFGHHHQYFLANFFDYLKKDLFGSFPGGATKVPCLHRPLWLHSCRRWWSQLQWRYALGIAIVWSKRANFLMS